MAKGVWSEDIVGEDAKTAFQREMIFPIGEPNTAYAQYFIGNSYLAPVSREQVNISNVTFEPRCRNNWHIHRATKGGGQMLIGVAGRGWYQEEGKPAVEILPGTVIHIPANVKHWHGAAPASAVALRNPRRLIFILLFSSINLRFYITPFAHSPACLTLPFNNCPSPHVIFG